MSQIPIPALIELLENVRKRPGMYLGSVDKSSLSSFFAGMDIAFQLLLGLRLRDKRYDSLYSQITHKHGWNDDSSFGAYTDMRNRGLTEPEIVDEYLSIEIELWKRVLSSEGDRQKD